MALGTLHGDTRIAGGMVAVDALLPGLGDLQGGHGVALLDCETTGLSGGTGTVAFMVGIARLEESGVDFTQLLIPKFGAEPAMLSQLREELHGVGVVVTYNGKSFDQPLLQSRYRLCGLADPFAAFRHLDLLALTRRLFARRWPNCRLVTAETRLLGFERSDDLPGSEAPQAWLDWLRHRRTANLERVFAHNHWDLVSLAALLPRLAETYFGHQHPDVDPRAIARGLVERQGPEAALQHLNNLGDALEPDDLSLVGTLAKRVGDWPLAVSTWERLASRNCPRALLELAMYHEHRGGNLETALEITERMLSLEGELADLQHRKNRLLRKMGVGPSVAGKCANLR
jgi:hypothetical protein